MGTTPRATLGEKVAECLRSLQYELLDAPPAFIHARRATPTGEERTTVVCYNPRSVRLAQLLETGDLRPQWSVHPDARPPTDDDKVTAELIGSTLISYAGFLDRTIRGLDLARDLYNDAELLQAANGYVPQKVTDEFGESHEDSLEYVQSFCQDRPARLLVILAPAGFGKTTLTQVLCRAASLRYIEAHVKGRVAPPLPFLIPFGGYRRLTSFRGIIGERLETLRRGDYTSEALRFLLHEGRISLLLDGFDELLEFSPSRAQDNLQEILSHVSGQGATVVTSRSTFFATKAEVLAFLRGQLPSGQVVVAQLDGFDEARQSSFLAKKGCTTQESERVLRLGASADLSRNPQNLEFLLQIVRSDTEGVTRVHSPRDVFERLFAQIFERERRRQRYSYSDQQQSLFLKDLAFNLWLQGDNVMRPDDVQILTPLDERSHLLLGHHVLRPTPSGDLTFEHHRVRDYFIAAELTRRMVTDSDGAADLLSRSIPDGVVTFLADSVTEEQFKQVRARAGRGSAATRNVVALALALVRRAGLRDRPDKTARFRDLLGGTAIGSASLSGLEFEHLDLRGWEFRRCDLSKATFRFCDLRDCRFPESDLAAARVEDCTLAEPALAEKRQRVTEAVRNQVRLFAVDVSTGRLRPRIPEEEAERDHQYHPEVMRALCTGGVIRRVRRERSTWFLEPVQTDEMTSFLLTGTTTASLGTVVDGLVRRSRV